MTRRESFIKIVEKEIFDNPDVYGENYPEDFEKALLYFEALKAQSDVVVEKPLFTDNGKLILQYMQDNLNEYPELKARDIAEGLFVSSRTVSGAIRKLITDGYVAKVGTNPVVYSLTDAGENILLED